MLAHPEHREVFPLAPEPIEKADGIGKNDCERNCSHGENHLATVFAHLMPPAFFIDQARRRSCRLFQAARAKAERPPHFRQKVGSLFTTHIPRDWETLYGAIAFGVRPRGPELLDTSRRPAGAGCAKRRFFGENAR